MRAIIAFVFATVIAIGLGLAMYLGAFKPVDLTETEAGPYRLVYKHHDGAYHKIVPVIEEIERWAVINGETCQTSFGEYVDDPNQVAEDRLNSNGGCLVTQDWSGKLPEGFEYREIPKRLFVLAVFTGAPSIGPQKVYPKVADYIKEHGLKNDGAVIEMYKRTGVDKLETTYHFPVSH